MDSAIEISDMNPTTNAESKSNSKSNSKSSTLGVTLDSDGVLLRSDQFGTVNSDDGAEPELRPRQHLDGDSICVYQAFGALRPSALTDRPSPDLKEVCPLLACAVIAGALAIWSLYPVRQMTSQFLHDHHRPKKSFVTLLPPWCAVLSLGIGLLSDCSPLCRYRRKSYMALGYFLTIVAAVALAAVSSWMDPDSQASLVLHLVLLVALTIGIQIAWITLLAASVEFAQRETLYQRGTLQASLFVLYFFGMSITQIAAAAVLHPNEEGVLYTSDLSLAAIAMVLAALALLPLPILYLYWPEDPVENNCAQPLRKRVGELGRLVSQKAVYQLLVALCVMVVFTAANNSNVNSVARFTSGFTGADVQWLYLSVYIPRCLSALIWRQCLINVNWRVVAGGGFVLIYALKGTCTMMLINNIFRGRVLYILMNLFAQIPQGWIILFQYIPTTEITYVGREGTMIGLVQTCLILTSIGATALWTWMQRVVNLNVTTAEIKADTIHMRQNATLATLLIFGFNALCISMTFFLPRQKLHAQQQRAFGGYHKLTRDALLLVFAALLAFDLHNNITKMIKL